MLLPMACIGFTMSKFTHSLQRPGSKHGVYVLNRGTPSIAELTNLLHTNLSFLQPFKKSALCQPFTLQSRNFRTAPATLGLVFTFAVKLLLSNYFKCEQYHILFKNSPLLYAQGIEYIYHICNFKGWLLQIFKLGLSGPGYQICVQFSTNDLYKPSLVFQKNVVQYFLQSTLVWKKSNF